MNNSIIYSIKLLYLGHFRFRELQIIMYMLIVITIINNSIKQHKWVWFVWNVVLFLLLGRLEENIVYKSWVDAIFIYSLMLFRFIFFVVAILYILIVCYHREIRYIIQRSHIFAMEEASRLRELRQQN